MPKLPKLTQKEDVVIQGYKLTQPFSLNIPRCRHLKVNGTQCGSPALKDHRFCYFHQRWHERKIVINRCSRVPHVSGSSKRGNQDATTNPRVPHVSGSSRRGKAITLPCLEDANSIQIAVMEIMQLLLEGQIDQKTAGLLFYGLQIASSNLKHINFEPEIKNDIVIDPKKLRETGLAQPLWKNGDFEETADGKIKLEDYDMTDLTIRVIDQMRKASGWEPLPRDIRETYAPWTLTDTPKET
jgi:hypothetical protein